MSVHFDVSKISFFGLDEWSVGVCAWRGCCIEVFARAEHSIADCLRTLAGAGVPVGREALNPFGANRLKALRTCIAAQGYGGHGKAALRRIAEWERVYELRARLAHGEVRATPHGISVSHTTFDGKAETRHPPKTYTRIEMLEMLASIEAAQRSLHHQLGQIKAIALKKMPSPDPRPAAGQESPG